MRVLILNGALGPDPLCEALADRLRTHFESQRASVEVEALHDTAVAWCQGCFECWTHTPGTCKIHDAGRDLARAFVQSDIVIAVTPCAFGSYSSAVKKVLDRSIGMLLPFFRRLHGETHHAPRYAYPPAFGVLAVLPTADDDIATTVRTLTLRNAINFTSPVHDTVIVTRDTPLPRQLAAADDLAQRLTAPTDPVPVAERAIEDVDRLLPVLPRFGAGSRPRRAMLLVGSAKPRGQSTSETLGVELMERLALHGVETTVRWVHVHAHDPAGVAQLVAELRETDLLVVASPIYVDALPHLVTALLEAVADDRARHGAPRLLAVSFLLNCGFPEARHAAVARTIGALFARRAQATWAGALQLGEGGALAGAPLEDRGSLARHLVYALDEAARALAEGDPLPDGAITRFQQPLMPALVYAAAADLGWLWSAAHEGALPHLWQRPDQRAPHPAPSRQRPSASAVPPVC